jgi:general L-amino acid transport system ATP-binding protein
MTAMTDPQDTHAAPERKTLTVSDEVAIEIRNMNKWFGEFHVLRDIDLS